MSSAHIESRSVERCIRSSSIDEDWAEYRRQPLARRDRVDVGADGHRHEAFI